MAGPRVRIEFVREPMMRTEFPMGVVPIEFPCPRGNAELQEPPPAQHDGLIWKDPSPFSKSKMIIALEFSGFGAASKSRSSPCRPNDLALLMNSSERTVPAPGTRGTEKLPRTGWVPSCNDLGTALAGTIGNESESVYAVLSFFPPPIVETTIVCFQLQADFPPALP